MVVWAYSTSFHGVFVFDDRPAIQENQSIRSWKTAWRPDPTSPLSGRPVANLTFAINHALGHDLAGYHAFNLVVHVGAVLLVFGVSRQTLLRMHSGVRARATALAFAVAVIWGVHPLNTGAVTYVVQRVESLMGFFYLLTLYAAIVANGSSWRQSWRILAVLACALGMGSKEVMISAPVIVWLWHVVFAAAPWIPWRDTERRSFYAWLCSTWIIPVALAILGTEARTALIAAWDATAAGRGWTPLTYLWTQADVVVHYFRLAFIPAPLSLDYYGWPRSASPFDVMPQLVLLIGLLVATGVALKRRLPFGFAGAWVALILAPTSSLLPIPTEIAAEHRMYLPLIAIIATVVIGGYSLIALRFQRVESAETRRRGFTIAVAAVALAVILASQTRARGRDYWSEEGLWRDTVDTRPGNARARVNYGITLMAARRYGDAERQMREALRLRVDSDTAAQIQLQLGASLCAQGRCAEGIGFMEAALQLDPGLDDADPVLGQAYSDIGDIAKALYYLRRAADKTPDSAPLLTRLAWLLATTEPAFRNPQDAVVFAERAVRLTGRKDAAALDALGAALAANGRFAEAMAAARDAASAAEAAGDRRAAVALREQVESYRRASEGVAKPR